jgi:hypothetical protein
LGNYIFTLPTSLGPAARHPTEKRQVELGNDHCAREIVHYSAVAESRRRVGKGARDRCGKTVLFGMWENDNVFHDRASTIRINTSSSQRLALDQSSRPRQPAVCDHGSTGQRFIALLSLTWIGAPVEAQPVAALSTVGILLAQDNFNNVGEARA